MSGDELFVMLASAALALLGWGRWYYAIGRATRLAASQAQRLPLYLAPVVALFVIFAVLRRSAASDVRDDPTYLWFYIVLGMAWVALARMFFPLAGLQPVDDAVHRRNPAAAHATVGALTGFAFAFAGANIGDGPGWWVVLFCSLLSSAALLGLWILTDLACGATEAVTVDRDESAGVRLGAMLASAGLIVGRAVAGDWHSMSATIDDFILAAWPVVPLGAIHVVTQRLLRPTPEHPTHHPILQGLLPGFIYAAGAVYYLWSLGWW